MPKRERTLLELATTPPRVTEKDEERRCDALAARLSASIVSFSQGRETRQTEGIPDRRYRHRGDACWFEVKPPDGQLSREQYDFLKAEAECGAIVGAGGELELAMLLSAPSAERWRRGLQLVEDIARRGFRGERKDGTPYGRRPPKVYGQARGGGKSARAQLVRRT